MATTLDIDLTHGTSAKFLIVVIRGGRNEYVAVRRTINTDCTVGMAMATGRDSA
jgi:hypothetical protein